MTFAASVTSIEDATYVPAEIIFEYISLTL